MGKYPLFFPVEIKENVADNNELSYVDKKYINLNVVYSDEDEQKMIEAAKCYLTQFTPNEIKDLADLVTNDRTNTAYFREFVVSQKNTTGFWD